MMDKNKDKGAKNESISNRGETFRCERYCACIKVCKKYFWCDRVREVCSDMGARSSCDAGRSGRIQQRV